MPESADLVHLTGRGIDYQNHKVQDFMLSSINYRPFCALLILCGLIGSGVLSAQDVQMVPDKQDQESAIM